MFKFNFSVENEENGANEDESTKDSVDGQEDRSEKRARPEEEFGMWTFEQLAELKLNEKTNHPPPTFRKLYLNRPPKLGEHNYDLVEERDSSSDEQYAYVEFVTELGLDENDALARINKTHDLVSGKYEGGLKVWELSIDLARLIYNLNTVEHFDAQTQSSTIVDDLKSIRAFFHHTISDESVTEFRLLELGCGHALPSLAVLKLIDTLLHRSSPLKIIVYLQDFNKNVIKNITFENINNYLRTLSTHSSAKIDVKFVYGDWQEIYENDRESLSSSSSSVTSQTQLLPENYFHLILTSETIYNRNNYKHLLNLFKVCLLNENRFDSTNYETKTSAIQSEQKSIKLTTTTTTNLSDKTTNEPEINTRTNTTSSSFVLLSAKTYYFGCGGNLYEFLNVAKSTGYLFKSTGNLLVDLLITNTPPRSDSKINNFNNSSNHSTNDNDATNSTFDNHKLEQQQQSESTNDVNSNTNNAFVSFSTISKEIIKIYPS